MEESAPVRAIGQSRHRGTFLVAVDCLKEGLVVHPVDLLVANRVLLEEVVDFEVVVLTWAHSGTQEVAVVVASLIFQLPFWRLFRSLMLPGVDERWEEGMNPGDAPEKLALLHL